MGGRKWKNTKYFANLEKKRSETKTMKRQVIDNTEITNPQSILKLLRHR